MALPLRGIRVPALQRWLAWIFLRKKTYIGNVRRNEGLFKELLESLYDLPIVGDVRGTGDSIVATTDCQCR